MDIKEVTRKRLEKLGISIEGLIALMNEKTEEQSKIPLENKVKNILHRLGGPAHIKGYQYAVDAIIMAVNDKSVIENMTKGIYPGVAEKNNTTPSRVERAMRHWIGVAWERSTEEEQREIFGAAVNSTRGRPTNSEFIAMIADYIRMGGE